MKINSILLGSVVIPEFVEHGYLFLLLGSDGSSSGSMAFSLC